VGGRCWRWHCAAPPPTCGGRQRGTDLDGWQLRWGFRRPPLRFLSRFLVEHAASWSSFLELFPSCLALSCRHAMRAAQPSLNRRGTPGQPPPSQKYSTLSVGAVHTRHTALARPAVARGGRIVPGFNATRTAQQALGAGAVAGAIRAVRRAACSTPTKSSPRGPSRCGLQGSVEQPCDGGLHACTRMHALACAAPCW